MAGTLRESGWLTASQAVAISEATLSASVFVLVVVSPGLLHGGLHGVPRGVAAALVFLLGVVGAQGARLLLSHRAAGLVWTAVLPASGLAWPARYGGHATGINLAVLALLAITAWKARAVTTRAHDVPPPVW